jgi:hypothetical protein
MNTDNHSKQPFYVVDDEAYDRMMEKLVGGERYVKTYLAVCTETCKCKCNCKFFLNFLKDGDIVRVSNGELKNVLRLSTFNELNEKKKFIQEYNDSLPQQTYYDSDGEEHTFAINGIYDSEQMCYLFENIESPRIKRIKAEQEMGFAGVMKRLNQDTLLSLIRILKKEFYESAEYGTPKDQRKVKFTDMLRPEISLAERKKTLINAIGDELGRITHGVDLQAKIDKIYIHLRG